MKLQQQLIENLSCELINEVSEILMVAVVQAVVTRHDEAMLLPTRSAVLLAQEQTGTLEDFIPWEEAHDLFGDDRVAYNLFIEAANAMMAEAYNLVLNRHPIGLH